MRTLEDILKSFLKSTSISVSVIAPYVRDISLLNGLKFSDIPEGKFQFIICMYVCMYVGTHWIMSSYNGSSKTEFTNLHRPTEIVDWFDTKINHHF